MVINIDLSWLAVIMLSSLILGMILGVRVARPRSRWD